MAEANQPGGGNVDVLREIESLVGFEGRRAGSDAERRAAKHLTDRLTQLGRDAGSEPIRILPAFAGAQLLHAAAGVVGSVLSVYVPAAGFVLVLAAAISAFGDLTGAYFLGRMPFGARASQNVISHENADKPGRLILVASYDARRGGMLFGERLRRWPTVLMGSLIVVLVCTIPRVLGIHPTFLTVIQFLATVALIVLAPLFIDVALSPVDNGANWNASGVATVLALAKRYGGRLEHFNLSVLFTGASHPVPLGMRGWLRRHRGDVDSETTAVLALESAGYGTPRYATKEGFVFPARLHPSLTQLAEELETAKPYVARSLSAAYLARSAGIPALRVSSLGVREYAPDTVDPDALARTQEFLSELIERIDAEIGPELAG